MATLEEKAANDLRIKIALQSGRRINPSVNDPWHGTPASGSRWTHQQLAKLKSERRNPDTIGWHAVPLMVPSKRDPCLPPEKTYLRCPLIAKSRDGRRVLIIAPAGDKLWTDAA